MVHERATGPRYVVLAGTGTHVGKTWTARALAHALRSVGRDVVAIKPIETGCAGAPADSEDGVALSLASGQASPRAALLRFASPVTPALAAERDGRAIDWDALVADVATHARGHAIALVEGAGGLLSPLTWSRTLVDLALALDAEVWLVGRDALGVLHDVSACLVVAESRGLSVAQLVLTAPEHADASTGTNAGAITRLFPALPCLVTPREPDPRQAAPVLAQAAARL